MTESPVRGGDSGLHPHGWRVVREDGKVLPYGVRDADPAFHCRSECPVGHDGAVSGDPRRDAREGIRPGSNTSFQKMNSNKSIFLLKLDYGSGLIFLAPTGMTCSTIFELKPKLS